MRAIKQIKKSSIKNPTQFVNEMEILKKVDHPNIIKIYETYEDENNYYVVTEYIVFYLVSVKEANFSIGSFKKAVFLSFKQEKFLGKCSMLLNIVMVKK